MARLHIDLPEKFVFSTALPVRVSDLNYGNHVGNDSVLTLMQEARALFYKSLGFKSEIELDGPVGQVVADAAVVYKSESFFGDVLQVAIGLGEFHKYGFDLFYKITNQLTEKEVARGKTGIICFDYEKRKMALIPESLHNKLTSL
jgi:YbgC/YbaW family acyl-CoA thioester hydrolase